MLSASISWLVQRTWACIRVEKTTLNGAMTVINTQQVSRKGGMKL